MSRPHQAAGLKRTGSSDANVLWPNVVGTRWGLGHPGAEWEKLTEKVENILQTENDLVKTSEGSNASGVLLLSLAAWTGEI